MTEGSNQAANIAGNYYDKYASRNPIVRALMQGFFNALDDLITASKAHSFMEIGCGEGHISARYAARGLGPIMAGDIDPDITASAARAYGHLGIQFTPLDMMNLNSEVVKATPLLLACEVFEHLPQPEEALEALAAHQPKQVILSVPREPIWRAMNMARGKYWPAFGNTPGHLNHWSKSGFLRFVTTYFDIIAVRSPLPWTLVLCRPKHSTNG